MWLPCLLLGAFALWRYRQACFTVSEDPFGRLMDVAGDNIGRFRHRLMRRAGWEQAS